MFVFLFPRDNNSGNSSGFTAFVFNTFVRFTICSETGHANGHGGAHDGEGGPGAPDAVHVRPRGICGDLRKGIIIRMSGPLRLNDAFM